MTQSGEKQQSRWDNGKGKKDANWARDMKRKGHHLTIIIQGVITEVSVFCFTMQIRLRWEDWGEIELITTYEEEEPLRPKQIHPIVIISYFPWVGVEPVWNSLIEMQSGSNTAENQTTLSSIVKTILHCTSLVPIAGEGLYEKWIIWPYKKCSSNNGTFIFANVSPDSRIGISLSKARGHGQVTGLWVWLGNSFTF